jgi:hypothetical protein
MLSSLTPLASRPCVLLSSLSSLSFAAALSLNAAPASAQPPPGTAAPAQTAPAQPPTAAGPQSEPSAADRETARALLLDGRAKLQAKDFQGAFRSFKAAHAIMGVPTTGLDLAKAEEALGQLVEARVTALDVTRLPVRPNEPEAFTNARAEAAAFAEKLAERIPSLLITVKPCAPDAAVSVTVDGQRIPPASLSLPRKSNPGAREIKASAPGCAGEARKVDLAEGATVPVEITLAKAAPTPKGAPDAAGPATSPSFGERLSSAPAWSLIAAGAGALAVGVSVVFIADYAKTRGTIADDCPNNTCSRYTVAQAEDATARLNRDAALFVTLGAAGVASITAGLFGILTSNPKEPSGSGGDKESAIAPWVSPRGGGAVLIGSF